MLVWFELMSKGLNLCVRGGMPMVHMLKTIQRGKTDINGYTHRFMFTTKTIRTINLKIPVQILRLEQSAHKIAQQRRQK